MPVGAAIPISPVISSVEQMLDAEQQHLARNSPSPDGRRTALCLSGGGIRSAAFSLGVLQALAGGRLLTEFDYLSTVSGGGFIGGWLQVLIHRKGVPGAEDDAARQAGAGSWSTCAATPTISPRRSARSRATPGPRSRSTCATCC